MLSYVWNLPFGQHTGFMNALLGGWSYNGSFAYQTGAHWSPYTRAFEDLVEISDGTTPCTANDVNTANCENIGGDFMLNRTNSHARNSRPSSAIAGFSGATHDMWANGWGPQWAIGVPGAMFSAPCLGCASNLGRNTFVGPGFWASDMSLFKSFKFTERVALKFSVDAFNIFNHTNFVLAQSGQAAAETTHNQLATADNVGGFTNFGQAGGTLNPRNLQLGLKLSF